MIAGILDRFVDVFADTVEYKQNHFAVRVFQLLQSFVNLLRYGWIALHDRLRFEVNAVSFDDLDTFDSRVSQRWTTYMRKLLDELLCNGQLMRIRFLC